MISWSSQPLPSGSLNDAYVKYERPSTRSPGAAFVHLADVDAAADEIVPGGVDVFDREYQPVSGPGLSRREALAEVDRALRVGRRELHPPEVVAGGKVGVQPPSEALVEALRPIDIGDGQRHDLEPRGSRSPRPPTEAPSGCPLHRAMLPRCLPSGLSFQTFDSEVRQP